MENSLLIGNGLNLTMSSDITKYIENASECNKDAEKKDLEYADRISRCYENIFYTWFLIKQYSYDETCFYNSTMFVNEFNGILLPIMDYRFRNQEYDYCIRLINKINTYLAGEESDLYVEEVAEFFRRINDNNLKRVALQQIKILFSMVEG